MTGKMGHKMRFDPDRAHTRAATAMRNTEGFVKVQVTDVPSKVTRA